MHKQVKSFKSVSGDNYIYHKIHSIIMNFHALKMFGSVFLIVALVGLVTIIGTNEQPIKTKSFGNNVIFHSNLLNNYLNPPKIPEADLNSPWLNAHIPTGYEGGPGLPDDFVFVSPCLNRVRGCI